MIHKHSLHFGRITKPSTSDGMLGGPPPIGAASLIRTKARHTHLAEIGQREQLTDEAIRSLSDKAR